MNFEDLLLLLELFAGCESSQDVGAALANMIKPFGYLMTSCGGSRETPTGRMWDFFFNTWPAEWLLEYQTKDYVRVDLVPAMARLTAMPFTWRELLREKRQSPQQLAFNARISEMGIVDGFAVPIHLPGADVGLCVCVADHEIADIQERSILHLASLNAYQRCRELGGLIAASSVGANLSPRELQCLKWILEGKSDTDIGAILGISHTTVHFHVERVKKKLGVRTRTQAAATIVKLGYL